MCKASRKVNGLKKGKLEVEVEVAESGDRGNRPRWLEREGFGYTEPIPI